MRLTDFLKLFFDLLTTKKLLTIFGIVRNCNALQSANFCVISIVVLLLIAYNYWL